MTCEPRGIIPALTTPFRDGRVAPDQGRLGEWVDREMLPGRLLAG